MSPLTAVFLRKKKISSEEELIEVLQDCLNGITLADLLDTGAALLTAGLAARKSAGRKMFCTQMLLQQIEPEAL